MNWLLALKLGRVSNLPTVWTNTLAGTVLAGGAAGSLSTVLVVISMSLYYIGGMYLNDAFDASIDSQERPERPIPSGQISRTTVLLCGFAMLLAGELLLLIVSPGAALAGVVLALAIVGYNYHHKNNPWSPLLMGLCRICIYATAALAVTSSLSLPVIAAAVALFCYLIGLTYAAKQENLARLSNSWPLLCLAVPVFYGLYSASMQGASWQWASWLLCLLLALWIIYAVRHISSGRPGGIPRGVVSLIAGISLLDALLISSTGSVPLALLAVSGFILTLAFQRYIPGT